MRPKTAFTLLELVVVLFILAALASVLTPLFTGAIHDAYKVSTESTLVAIRDALQEYWNDTKLVTLDGMATVGTESDRLSIQWLFDNPVTGDDTWDYNPNTRIGWRGPYMLQATGDPLAPGAPILIDAWNNSIVIQDVNSAATLRDVRIVSGGQDGSIDIPASTATSALTANDVGDDVYVALSLR